MIKKYTCIICPNSCEIEADIHDTQVGAIEGNRCPKGEAYVRQEIINPCRTIATSVLVRHGVLPLASVRLTKAIPRQKIFPVMEEIKKIVLEAPVHEGTVVIEKVLGLDSDVVVTRAVEKIS